MRFILFLAGLSLLISGVPAMAQSTDAPAQPLPEALSPEAINDLASKLDIDAVELERTIARWNSCVVDGKDHDFHRGESAHDTWWGDPQEKGVPAATLGPLDSPPFYAVEVKSGALGTKGGPKTDSLARVQSLDGGTIPGLYAAGNVMASVMGMTW